MTPNKHIEEKIKEFDKKFFDKEFIDVSMLVRNPNGTISREPYGSQVIKDFLRTALSSAFLAGRFEMTESVKKREKEIFKLGQNSVREEVKQNFPKRIMRMGDPSEEPMYDPAFINGWNSCRAQTLSNISKLQE